MREEPLISIIIPALNRGSLIGKTLESVVSQTYINWECLVIDDGSTDNTPEIISNYCRKDSRLKIYHRPKNRLPGGNAARNYGFELSKGDYLIFFDSDDIMIRDMISKRVHEIQKTKVDMFINNALMFSKVCGDKNILWNNVNPKANNDYVELVLRFLNLDMPWCTNGVTWSRAFFSNVGGWDEELRSWQDWELHLRALFFNPSIQFSNKAYDSFFRFNGNQNSIGRLNKTRNYLHSVEKAVLKTEEKLKKHPSIYQVVKQDFEKLILATFIKFRVANGFKVEPLRYFFRHPFFFGMERKVFIKFYLIELLCSSYKIRTYILKNVCQKHSLKTKMRSRHMRFSLKDL